jgi:4'-phosphopantetheinyl transferase
MKIPESIDSTKYNILCHKVSKEREARIFNEMNRYNIQSLFTELLLRYTLNSILGLREKDIAFQYNKFGKPSLIGGPSAEIKFNLSHSGSWILCGISNNELGVDIQKIGEFKLNIAKRFFALREYNSLLCLAKGDATKRFYEYWALKESYIKAVGKGLSIPLNTVEFLINSDEVKGFIDGLETTEFQFQLIPIDPNYTSAVCLRSDELELSHVIFEKIELEQIICWFT